MSKFPLKQRNYRRNIYQLPNPKCGEKAVSRFRWRPTWLPFTSGYFDKHEVRKMAVGLTDTSNKIAKTITKYYQTLKKIHIFRLQILFPHSNCQRHTGLLRGSEVTSAKADRARDLCMSRSCSVFRVLFAVLVRVASLIQAHKLFDLIWFIRPLCQSHM